MNVLIVHQNFPGQFPHIADALVKRGDRVAAIGGPTAKGRPGVDLRRWSNGRGTTKGIFPPAIRAEADLIRAEAAAVTAEQLKRDGFVPDVIVGHPGWGETLHLKLVWPDARMILFGEYWYLPNGGDSDFDSEFAQVSSPESQRIHAKNATGALAYSEAARIIAPTHFQASTFPVQFRERMTIAHEGVDLSMAVRAGDARVRLPDGRFLDGSRPVVTYVSRTLEPLRGFHIFMRALPTFLRACPDVEVVIIGREGERGYGAAAPGGRTWKSALLAELGDRLDRGRVHFLGAVPYNTMIAAFSLSTAHVYYTYPFTLSWSLVEAMACSCYVIASDTPPVRDAIEHGVSGRLLPFFDVAALSQAMIDGVQAPAAALSMRQAARISAVERFSRVEGTRAWLDAIDHVN